MKIVLITGGTRGVGAALVEQYLARGFKVISTGSSQTTVDKAIENFPLVDWYVCNLADESSIDRFCMQMVNQELDIVIHNAGVQQLRNFFDLEPKSISSVDETMINLTAPILLTEKLFNNVFSTKGTWVYITSGLAIAPKQSSPVYCANKAGLRAFTKSLRAQAKLGKHPIRVCEAILPLVDTDMTRGRGKGKISAEEAAKQIVAGVDKEKPEIQVGITKVLMNVRKLFPNFAESIMLRS
ncbi:SDR family NAD(P)-dependent oxidoreductase [Vibrio sonorensis]|uniref:SDR family NAD(P)-dependent oxidoreductase n=1 Tax=Vibrio sonorensis TaxID=1004316 RepID=UPI001FE1B6CF|nr:SDR family NAD(P)-dependent oxidoreductase [Vibrio sonorensis]